MDKGLKNFLIGIVTISFLILAIVYFSQEINFHYKMRVYDKTGVLKLSNSIYCKKEIRKVVKKGKTPKKDENIKCFNYSK